MGWSCAGLSGTRRSGLLRMRGFSILPGATRVVRGTLRHLPERGAIALGLQKRSMECGFHLGHLWHSDKNCGYIWRVSVGRQAGGLAGGMRLMSRI